MDRRNLLRMMFGAAGAAIVGQAIGSSEAVASSPAPLPKTPVPEKNGDLPDDAKRHLDENSGEYAQYYRRRYVSRRYVARPRYRGRVYGADLFIAGVGSIGVVRSTASIDPFAGHAAITDPWFDQVLTVCKHDGARSNAR